MKSIWQKRSSRKKALTLLELLVSIALLGLLLFGVASFLEVMGKSSKALKKSPLQQERELLYQTLYPYLERLDSRIDNALCEKDFCHFEFDFTSKADRDPHFIGKMQLFFDFKDGVIRVTISPKKASTPPIPPRQIFELHGIKDCSFEQIKFDKTTKNKSSSILRLFLKNESESAEACFLLRQKGES